MIRVVFVKMSGKTFTMRIVYKEIHSQVVWFMSCELCVGDPTTRKG